MEFTFHEVKVRVNIPDMQALEQAVTARMAAGDGFALATINMDHLDKLKDDAGFRAAYLAQDFVVADGNPIVWLSRLAGRPVELIPGSDLVLPLASWAAASGVKVALVGSTKEALAASGARLRAEVPGLEIVAEIAPPMGFDPSGATGAEVLGEVGKSDAGLVFLALGAPKQEMFAARGRKDLPGVGFASIGAGLDFLAGRQKRAPAWVRAVAMEWLWRAATNPLRLGKRYLHSLIRLPGHMARALRLRMRERDVGNP